MCDSAQAFGVRNESRCAAYTAKVTERCSEPAFRKGHARPAELLKCHMTADDFRRIALSLPGAEQGAHMGAADFRIGGHIFATLASLKQGYGNLMLSPEQQAAFVGEQPDIFMPIAGGWGRMGATHIRLAKANEDGLHGALLAAWKLRSEKNKKQRKPKARPPE